MGMHLCISWRLYQSALVPIVVVVVDVVFVVVVLVVVFRLL